VKTSNLTYWDNLERMQNQRINAVGGGGGWIASVANLGTACDSDSVLPGQGYSTPQEALSDCWVYCNGTMVISREKQTNSEKNMPKWHFIHHKSQESPLGLKWSFYHDNAALTYTGMYSLGPADTQYTLTPVNWLTQRSAHTDVCTALPRIYYVQTI
jgi:hypothetical protein